MKKGLAIIFISSVCLAFISIEKTGDKVFDQLYRLEGKWIMKTKKGAIGEEWIKIDKDYLQNRGFMIRGNDTFTTERVALKNTAAGIFYTSTVEDQNNRQPIAFRLTAAQDDTFVFENPQHDFPQRIIYSKTFKSNSD